MLIDIEELLNREIICKHCEKSFSEKQAKISILEISGENIKYCPYCEKAYEDNVLINEELKV